MPTQVSSLPVPPPSLALLADRLEDVPHLPPQQELARWLIASQVYHTKQQVFIVQKPVQIQNIICRTMLIMQRKSLENLSPGGSKEELILFSTGTPQRCWENIILEDSLALMCLGARCGSFLMGTSIWKVKLWFWLLFIKKKLRDVQQERKGISLNYSKLFFNYIEQLTSFCHWKLL